MLTVYGSAGRSFRVHWLLAELGRDYTLEPVRPQSPELLAVNPLGQVPVLRDGGHVLTDSLAILNYLADGARKFTQPPGTPQRALMDARINFVLTELEAPIWLMARHGFVLPKEDRHAGMRDVAEPDFHRGEAKFSALLGKAEFWGGDRFTIADVIAGHTLDWGEGAKIGLKTEVAQDYLARMKARPGWDAAQTRIGA